MKIEIVVLVTEKTIIRLRNDGEEAVCDAITDLVREGSRKFEIKKVLVDIPLLSSYVDSDTDVESVVVDVPTDIKNALNSAMQAHEACLLKEVRDAIFCSIAPGTYEVIREPNLFSIKRI